MSDGMHEHMRAARTAAVDRMARVIRAWLANNPGGDPEESTDLEALCERTSPGHSGGMWAAALRQARTSEASPADGRSHGE